eukprot:SAG11_NODE_640_length_8012_cov_14.412486_5_plen_88_part_00
MRMYTSNTTEEMRKCMRSLTIWCGVATSALAKKGSIHVRPQSVSGSGLRQKQKQQRDGTGRAKQQRDGTGRAKRRVCVCLRRLAISN